MAEARRDLERGTCLLKPQEGLQHGFRFLRQVPVLSLTFHRPISLSCIFKLTWRQPFQPLMGL